MDEDKQTTEVKQTNAQVGDTKVQRETVRRTSSMPTAVIAQRIIYYLGGVLLALLVVRLLFQLLGASEGSAFVDFIYGLSAVFVWPFSGMFGEPSFGVSHFETSSLVAIVIYGLLTVGLAKLVTLGSSHPEA